ncbi:MAG: methyltransferase domain-containing protein [Candidatus Thiodiazotropha endolucinida]
MSDNITEEYWSRFPDAYDKKMAYVVGKELVAEIIQELNRLPELGDLVEFGCGTGIYTETIVQKTTSMFATDLSDSLLAVARARIGDHPKLTIQKENCIATSFPSEALDSIFMANLIHVIENPSTLLQECYRILRKDGTLVIVTFTDHGMNLWEKIKMGLRFIKSRGKPPAHTHSFSPENLESMMKDAGFTIKTSKIIGNKTKALYIIGQKDKKA